MIRARVLQDGLPVALVALLLLGPARAEARPEGSIDTGIEQGLAYYSAVLIDVRAIGETIQLCSSDGGLAAVALERQGEEMLLQRPSAPSCNPGACPAGEVCRSFAAGLPPDPGEPAFCVIPLRVTAHGPGYCDAASGPGSWLQVAAQETGAYRLDLAGEEDRSGANTRYWAVSVLTPQGEEPIFGRVHSRLWSFNAHTFDGNPTSADFYALVPSGGVGSYVFVIDTEQMAGYVYSIFANSLGNNDTPSQSWCQYGRPNADGSCNPFDEQNPQLTPGHPIQPQYEIYLGFPDGVVDPQVTPQLEAFQFNDEAGTASLSPDGDGWQDSGEFSFQTNVSGTYRIIIDTDSDGLFNASGDVLLAGSAQVGPNRRRWSGTGADGQPLPPGRYLVQLSLHVAETHFPLIDIESNDQGIAIYRALGPSVDQHVPQRMYWDDTPVGGGTSLPDGTLGRHAWSWNGQAGRGGDLMSIDTWVQG
ncbi:MAG: hypothetical protein FJ125_17145, partial [Deltaproteobacteria bacterium]|nr:hypothetical protein [Deltaproteobacteria bacterium]